MKNLIIASNGRLHGQEYLEFLLDEIKIAKEETGFDEVVFIAFARPGGIPEEKYTEVAGKALAKIGLKVKNVMDGDAAENIAFAKAIFTGGGNTFLLTRKLHQLNLMEPLRQRLHDGCFYLGTSAGSNIAGLTMQNTNDMPIVDPINYKTLGVIPYNINAHYIAHKEVENHMGETRADRIREFHFHNTIPVVGLPEGSWIRVKGNNHLLGGDGDAVIFRAGQDPKTVSKGHNFNQLN